MSLTLKDFRTLIDQYMAQQGLTSHCGLNTAISEAYGPGFIQAMRVYGSRELTQEGVDEYNKVKAWFAAGCDGDLVPVHSSKIGVDNKRLVPLFKRLTTWVQSGVAVAPKVERPRAAAAQPKPTRYADPEAQFAKLQQANVALFLRSALLVVYKDPRTPADTKAYVQGVLDTCQAELQRMINL